MENKIPTQEQSKEFWLLCGFKYGKYDFVSSLSPELNFVATGWLSPEATSEPYDSKYFSEEPPDLNPNNLFEYSVTKATKLGYDIDLFTEDGYYFGRARKTSALKWHISTIGYLNPALALFWVVYPVLKEKENAK